MVTGLRQAQHERPSSICAGSIVIFIRLAAMYKYLPNNLRQTITILLVAVTAICAVFLWQGRLGLSFYDEGFLWYGVQRVMAGEVPMRDFIAYDIGRYYWSAGLMGLMGDNGILSLRAAVAVFQALGLFVGFTFLVRNSTKQNYLFWLLALVTLVVWMYPRHKLFDVSLSMVLVGALSFLIERASIRRYFLMGLIVGVVAIFGRNHGLYGAAASMGAIIYHIAGGAGSPRLFVALASWISGFVAGYLPMLVYFIVVPGVAQAFADSIRVLFEFKVTNLALPVPWPWLVPFGKLPMVEMLRGVIKGGFFITIVAFGLLGIVWLIRQRLHKKYVSPVLVSSILLALPYAQYSYSRADIPHLALGISPFLIGGIALLASQSAKIKWPLLVMLCGASLLLMLPDQPGWECYSGRQCVEMNVAGDRLRIDSGTAGNLAKLNELAERYAPGDRAFLAAPFWPGAYAALGRRSPMWEIYVSAFPRSAAFQYAEIERIKAANPGFAVIDDSPLDGRDDLRFHNTHPLIDQYIRDNFEPLIEPLQNPDLHFYKSKQGKTK